MKSSATARQPLPVQRDPAWPIAPLWTVDDVAGYLQVPPQTLYSWRARGTGPRARKVGKYLRYRPEDVVQWLDGLTDPAA